MPEPLHVANGHCTTALIERAGLRGKTSIWADPLHEGPVPDVGDDQLIRVRAAFIANGIEVSADGRVSTQPLAGTTFRLYLHYNPGTGDVSGRSSE